MNELLRISKELLREKETSLSHSVGHRISFYNDKWDKEKTTVYLSCSHQNYTQAFNLLFRSADHFQSVQIIIINQEENQKIPSQVIDNCIKLPNHSLIQLTDNLNNSLCPIIEEYEGVQEPFNTVHITDGSQDFLSLFKQYGQTGTSIYATDYTELGSQMHLLPSYRLKELETNHFDYYRLGEMKKKPHTWEPTLRNQHVCLFDSNVLKKAELDAKKNANPSGFSSEEAIQLIRYAMVSPKMSFLLLYNIEEEKSLSAKSATWFAQAMWYAIQGAENRAFEKPFNNENLLEFLIDIQVLDYPLSFLKSKKTGRWWVKIPTKSSNYEESVYLPCTDTDFQQSRDGILPNRIVKAIARSQDGTKI